MPHTTPYIIKYLLELTPGQWYSINSLPKVIGLPGIINAEREQLLMPDYKIKIGRLFSTFRIERNKKTDMGITHWVQAV